MSLISWNNSLTLGIESVDEQHQELVRIINALHAAMLAGKTKEVVGTVLGELVTYTQVHFKYEEQLFRRCKYVNIASHMAEHAGLTKQVLDFKNRFDRGEAILSIDLMEFLRDWLSKHILESDMQYVSALKRARIH